MKITVAGVGYVGLSLAVLLAQKHEVTAITTTPAKAEKLNKFTRPSTMEVTAYRRTWSSSIRINATF